MTTIALPLPPVELKANRATQHWAGTHKAKTGYRAAVLDKLREYTWGDDTGRYPVSMLLTAYVGKGQREPDLADLGTWAKVALDQMVQYGIFKDDGPKYIHPLRLESGRDWDNPRLEITWWREES